MAKQRTKTGTWDTVGREVSPGLWQFEVGQLVWRWREGVRGLNTSVGRSEADLQLSLFFGTFEEVTLYALGFQGGMIYAAQQTAPPA